MGLTSLGLREVEGCWRLELKWGCCAVPTLLFCFCFSLKTAAEEEEAAVPSLTPTNPVGALTHLVVLLVKNLVFVFVFVVVSCSQCVLVPNLVSVTKNVPFVASTSTTLVFVANTLKSVENGFGVIVVV